MADEQTLPPIAEIIAGLPGVKRVRAVAAPTIAPLAKDGAPDLGGINYPGPWGDWQSWGIVFGIRATSDGGYDIILRHNEPFSPEGGPAGQYFSPIHFPRTPAAGA